MTQERLYFLYIDLLKKSLTSSLWPQLPIPITAFNYARPTSRRTLISAISNLLARKHLELFQYQSPKQPQWAEFEAWYSYSMAGPLRLDNLQYCVETVLHENTPGDFIETGVWRGGSCILMRAILATHNITDRKVWVADSFQGLPEPTPQDLNTRLCDVPFLSVSLEQVKHNFEIYNLLDSQVLFLPGWFKSTLPMAPISQLAILRLDGDLYSSTMDSLTNLYPKLSRNGFCIIDDYGLPGCKQAVDTYRYHNSISSPIQRIDWTGVYWRKQ